MLVAAGHTEQTSLPRHAVLIKCAEMPIRYASLGRGLRVLSTPYVVLIKSVE